MIQEDPSYQDACMYASVCVCLCVCVCMHVGWSVSVRAGCLFVLILFKIRYLFRRFMLHLFVLEGYTSTCHCQPLSFLKCFENNSTEKPISCLKGLERYKRDEGVTKKNEWGESFEEKPQAVYLFGLICGMCYSHLKLCSLMNFSPDGHPLVRTPSASPFHNSQGAVLTDPAPVSANIYNGISGLETSPRISAQKTYRRHHHSHWNSASIWNELALQLAPADEL